MSTYCDIQQNLTLKNKSSFSYWFSCFVSIHDNLFNAVLSKNSTDLNKHPPPNIYWIKRKETLSSLKKGLYGEIEYQHFAKLYLLQTHHIHDIPLLTDCIQWPSTAVQTIIQLRCQAKHVITCAVYQTHLLRWDIKT